MNSIIIIILNQCYLVVFGLGPEEFALALLLGVDERIDCRRVVERWHFDAGQLFGLCNNNNNNNKKFLEFLS